MSDQIRMKLPERLDALSVGGVAYEADDEHCIRVPVASLDECTRHGCVPVFDPETFVPAPEDAETASDNAGGDETSADDALAAVADADAEAAAAAMPEGTESAGGDVDAAAPESATETAASDAPAADAAEGGESRAARAEDVGEAPARSGRRRAGSQ